jgi:hypothetical protein
VLGVGVGSFVVWQLLNVDVLQVLLGACEASGVKAAVEIEDKQGQGMRRRDEC